MSADEPSGPPLVQRVGNGLMFGAAAFMAISFTFSVVKYWYNYNKSENKDRRKVCSSGSFAAEISNIRSPLKLFVFII